MAYFQTDAGLDFDEANAFFAALSDTVPSLEKPQQWNRDLDYDQLYNPAFESKFDPSSPEIISSNGSIDEMFVGSANESDFSNTMAPLYSTNDELFMPFIETEEETNSYANSQGSTMSPYLDFSPHSGPSSMHSPANMNKLNYEPVDSVQGVELAGLGGIPEFVPEIDTSRNPAFEIDAAIASQEWMYQQPEIKDEFQGELAPPDFEKSPQTENQNLPEIKPRAKSARVSKPERRQKTSHNVIEKKYRISINSKILELREAVPTLKFAGKARLSMADLDGLAPACKLNKASVLTKADEYIQHMEKKNKELQRNIRALQKLVSSASTGAQASLNASISQDSQNALNSYSSFLQSSVDSNLHQRRALQAQGSNERYDGFSNAPRRQIPIQPAPASISNRNSNLFLGGVATMMGSSYINDHNFQALSAVPIFPSSLFGSAGPAAPLVNALRMLTLGMGVFMIAVSIFGSSFFHAKKDKTPGVSEPVSWLLSITGVTPRECQSVDEQKQVCSMLMGSKASMGKWLKTYLSLRMKTSSFETLLLQFLVGTVIIKMETSFSKLVAFDLKWRKSALKTTAYSGNDENLRLINRLISEVDGVSMFESESFSTHLYNLSQKRPICEGTANGENASLLVDSLLRHENSVYGVVLEWRVLEIIHELTLVYLSLLTISSDDREEQMDELRKDSRKMAALVSESSYLSRQFAYFELLLAPESSPEVLRKDKQYILNSLQTFNQFMDDPELTDDEEISDDESDFSSPSMASSQSSLVERTDPLDLIREQKSTVCSFNLMNEEKFVVLTSSLITCYLNQGDTEKSLQLLGYLKLDEKKSSISLLSFTCLLRLLSLLVKSESDDVGMDSEIHKANEEIQENMTSRNCLVLESLVKVMRDWLKDDNKPAFLPRRLRSDLSALVINKGISINKI